jgi:hypothetical protein
LIVDEASRIKDELIAAASPTVATRPGANITYLSSPAGQRGAFHKAWASEEWWHKVKVTAQECPRISPAFLARERLRLGATLYAQEYLAEFVASAGGLFDPAALDDVFGRAAQPALEQWLPEGNGHARAWL